ncbi:helix-turn-helix domain-containing protein [Streptomyces goshikiensis]|uniref:helix-turn-helix domain-containing protein n=1 Tax=Streptomyces goshikiensis TaxID=1942 RepID=UPI0036D156F5
MFHPDPDFDRRAAALLRAAANDLKRDDTAAERDLGLAPGTFAELTCGERPVSWDLLSRAARVWPLSERDLLPLRDDAPRGVRVMRAEESFASSRTLSRGGVDYYEYRDTAMSRIASYRPEWIRMLQPVGDNDPLNPEVRWNRGHLLYQFTYFVGPVNYYHRWGDHVACVPMSTGDSVWGLPFAPHSFTTRSADEPAYILALTYGGELVGDAQRELAVLGADAARKSVLPFTEDAAAPALLRAFVLARALTLEELADRSGLTVAHVTALTDGERQPTEGDLGRLAEALGISIRDLLAPRTTTDGGVAVRHAASARRWHYPADSPAYRFTELAGDPSHPHTSALEVEVLADSVASASWLTTYQHTYLYVLGDQPVRLLWEAGGERHIADLRPGDSAYVAPQVPALFVSEGSEPTEAARILLLRIAGTVRPEVRHALGAMAEDGLQRYINEDRLWYATEGH